MWEPGKPSHNENEYFARQDEEWKKARRAQLDADRMLKEKAVPAMSCPRCGGNLVERKLTEAVIDVCSSCHGVWLDAGELEMLSHVSRDQAQHLIQSLNKAR